MYIESIKNRNSPPCILIRESYWENSKVKKRTLANISKLPPGVIASIRASLKQSKVSRFEDFDILASLPHGHVLAILQTFNFLALPSLIFSRPSRVRALCLAMIAQRIISAHSKLACARALHPDSATSSLGEELQLGSVHQKELYDALAWLGQRQRAIENKLAKRHLVKGVCVLYDLSSTWYEGSHCPLAARGHNRDKKQGKRQINFGLLCDLEGRPVAMEVFKGNVSDPATVASQVKRLRHSFGLSQVILVGDRGMLTSARLREDLEPDKQMAWITALRGDQIAGLLKDKERLPRLSEENPLAEIQHENFPGERLALCRNPRLAEERARKRTELLEVSEKELEKIRRAVDRKKNPYRGAGRIGRRIERECGKYKMLKHFILEITDEWLNYRRDEKRIEEESLRDGLYVIRAGRVRESSLNTHQLVETYKRLSRNEQAFRSLKSMSLKVRPIFHRQSDMVKAHLFLCMLAYYVEWEMERRLAPLLFKDEIPGGEKRSNPVLPAKRSSSAKAKAQSKKTPEGHNVHSFRGLLECLGTLCRHKIELSSHKEIHYYKESKANKLQERALELIGLKRYTKTKPTQ